MSKQDAGRSAYDSDEIAGSMHQDGGKDAGAPANIRFEVDSRKSEDWQGDQGQEIVIHAGYELFVVGFLIVQLVNSVLLFLGPDEQQRRIILQFWAGISVFLLVDAMAHLLRTHDKRRYLFAHLGWMTLAGSLPVPFITSLRLLATGVMLRRLRRGEFRAIGRVIVSQHAQSTLLFIIFLAVIFFEFGSFLVLTAEQDAPNANITTSADAIWWSLVTISTVGYGDTFPVTVSGRFVGAILIVSGVGLFTIITSFMARWFMRPRPAKRMILDAMQAPAGVQDQIGEIRTILTDMENNHQQAVRELTERLDRLEDSISSHDAADIHPATSGLKA